MNYRKLSFHCKRNSILLRNHKASGANLTEWNDMLVPDRYESDVDLEIFAVRQKAGLTDISGIKKFWIKGDDSASLVNFSITKDVRFIEQGQGVYAGFLNDEGKVMDDAIVFHLDKRSTNHFGATWLVCTGSGNAETLLIDSQLDRDARVEIDENLHCLLLQGPKAKEIISAYVIDPSLGKMNKFDTRLAKIGNRVVLISRTSYSGEDGFEIFAYANDILTIWDQLTKQYSGQFAKVGFDALEVLRIEAGLLFFGKDMTGHETPGELGLDFFVEDTSDFRGKKKYSSDKVNPKHRTIGVISDSINRLGYFKLFTSQSENVGIIRSYCFSPTLQKHIGLALINVREAYEGNILICCPNAALEAKSFTVSLTNRRFLTNKQN